MTKMTISLLTLITLVLSCSTTPVENKVKFMESTIEFASVEEAKTLLGTSDEFTKSLSPFDCEAKTQNKGNNKESDYLNYAEEQALEWSDSDKNKIITMLENVETKIKEKNLDLRLPDEIVLVHSTCKEEGGAAGYTRSNYIVVNGVPSDHLFLHELWHVISRENPLLRDKAYEIIGFEKMDRAIFPVELEKLRITNPDAPFMEHFIMLEADGEEKKMVITTMASAPYQEGSFFDYLMVVFYEVVDKDGQNVLKSIPPYAVDAVKGFREKIGNNTNYIIHPEEITAEHFTMMILGNDVDNQALLDGLNELLKK